MLHSFAANVQVTNDFAEQIVALILDYAREGGWPEAAATS